MLGNCCGSIDGATAGHYKVHVIILEDQVLNHDQKLEVYYYLRLTRFFEEWIYYICHNQNHKKPIIIGKGYLSTGQESMAVGGTYALNKEDWLAPSHRDMGAHLVKGFPLKKMILQYMGREGSPTQGRDGNVHFGDRAYNIIAFFSHMGGLTVAANGVAWAMKYKKQPNAVLCYYGDGASQQGCVHEALNYASVYNLPVVFCVNNNRWAISTSVRDQMNIDNLADRAAGYGMPSAICEGNNVYEVHDTIAKALERARAGEGPSLVECKSMRMAGHGTHDLAKYVPQEEYDEWAKKDPVAWAERILIEEGVADQAALDAIAAKAKKEVDDTVAECMQAGEIVATDKEFTDIFEKWN